MLEKPEWGIHDFLSLASSYAIESAKFAKAGTYLLVADGGPAI